MFLLPSWIPDFIKQAITYPSYTVYGSLTWIIVRHWLGLGQAAEIAVVVILALGTIFLAWRVWRGPWEQMLWIAGLLLLLTNFFTPRIATTNYVLLIPFALWGFRTMEVKWKKPGTLAVVFAQAASFVGLWILFLVTIQGDFEQAPTYIPFPIAIAFLLALIWGSASPGFLERLEASLHSTRDAPHNNQYP
jgi:hypothetical protein